MTHEVSLQLPDELYQRVSWLATTLEQPVEDAIIECLDKSIGPRSVNGFSLEGDEAEAEVAAFHARHAQLRRDFSGEYVALRGGKVVDHDPDRLLLFARVEQMYPDQFVLIRPVRAEIDREFHFRSPRLEPRS